MLGLKMSKNKISGDIGEQEIVNLVPDLFVIDCAFFFGVFQDFGFK